ncbi:MAG: response regulator transcription factor, partial [Planctomycetales bacterium]|nr:response regulator transcription factor [Planctomycetales bacterium]
MSSVEPHSENTSLRVVLADDHSMVRQALARVLEESQSIEVVAQACDGDEAVQAFRDHAPDVMVLDYSMAPHDAPGVIDQPLALDPEAKILLLTVHQNVHYAVPVL